MVELAALLPWDEALAPVLEPYPSFSWSVPEHTRMVRAPVPLRVDREGGLHLLGDAMTILHYDGHGAPLGRTPVPQRVRDFGCDSAGNCIVLEADRVRALDARGRERWSLTGGYDKVLLHLGHLYLPDTRGGTVTEVDAETGEAGRDLSMAPGASAPFLGGGRLLSVVYDEQRNRRGIAALDLDAGAASGLDGDLEHFPWLVYPFGADGASRLYVWSDGQVARITLRGAIEIVGAVDGVAVRDGAVFTSHGVDGHVVVSGPDRTVRLDAPSEMRLIHLDTAGRWYLVGGEAPDSAGELRIYSPDGVLESAGPPPEDLAAIDCRVPVHDAWQVDAHGAVLIPVTTPDGLAVVRLG